MDQALAAVRNLSALVVQFYTSTLAETGDPAVALDLARTYLLRMLPDPSTGPSHA